MFSSASSEIRKRTVQPSSFGSAESGEIFVPPRAVVRLPGAPREIDDHEDSADDGCFRTPSLSDPEPELHVVRSATQTEVLVRYSLPFARETCPSDAVVHRHLQEMQATVSSEYVRDGKLWIPQHSAQDICDALKCFKYRRQVSDALGRLAENEKIVTESTGKYLADYQWKNNKRDLATWHHVYAPLSDEDIKSFRAVDAIQYGFPKAMILAVCRGREIEKFDAQGNAYKKMSATELTKELPFDDQSIGTHLRKLVVDKVFVPHPVSAKYVCLCP